METTKTIGEWASETFGDAGSNARVAARANEEMAELLRAATSGQPVQDMVVEAADVVIVLARLAYRNGFDLWNEVEKKMAVNRARVWKKDGTGHGYHVRDKQPA
jgi:NTP pyrophosphatase (non-canonical NTP hydrolase)